MTAEKIYSISTPIVALLAGGSLALFVDSRALVYVICISSLFIATLLYSARAFRKTTHDHRILHYATVTYIAWAAASALFGLRSLQITSLGVVLAGSVLLSIFIGLVWMQTSSLKSIPWRVISLVAFEWFCVLLFAPGSYMVLGALFAVGVTTFATLFEQQSMNTLTRTAIIQTVVAALIIAAFFIAGFKWVL